MRLTFSPVKVESYFRSSFLFSIHSCGLSWAFMSYWFPLRLGTQSVGIFPKYSMILSRNSFWTDLLQFYCVAWTFAYLKAARTTEIGFWFCLCPRHEAVLRVLAVKCVELFKSFNLINDYVTAASILRATHRHSKYCPKWLNLKVFIITDLFPLYNRIFLLLFKVFWEPQLMNSKFTKTGFSKMPCCTLVMFNCEHFFIIQNC